MTLPCRWKGEEENSPDVDSRPGAIITEIRHSRQGRYRVRFLPTVGSCQAGRPCFRPSRSPSVTGRSTSPAECDVAAAEGGGVSAAVSRPAGARVIVPTAAAESAISTTEANGITSYGVGSRYRRIRRGNRRTTPVGSRALHTVPNHWPGSCARVPSSRRCTAPPGAAGIGQVAVVVRLPARRQAVPRVEGGLCPGPARILPTLLPVGRR